MTSGSPSAYRYRWAGPGAAGTAVDSAPLRLLRAWDRARAAAYADGSVAALRRLYVPGSETGAADVAMLRAYDERGYRVEGMRMQLLRVRVVGRRPGEWALRVTDRLHRAVAVGRGERLRLPRDRATTRVVRLVRSAGGSWQVAEVRRASSG